MNKYDIEHVNRMLKPKLEQQLTRIKKLEHDYNNIHMIVSVNCGTIKEMVNKIKELETIIADNMLTIVDEIKNVKGE